MKKQTWKKIASKKLLNLKAQLTITLATEDRISELGDTPQEWIIMKQNQSINKNRIRWWEKINEKLVDMARYDKKVSIGLNETSKGENKKKKQWLRDKRYEFSKTFKIHESIDPGSPISPKPTLEK